MKKLSIMECQRGFFIFIICFLRSCQLSHSIGLTIDNQLVIIASDCYTRVAIGSKLSDMDIFSSVAVSSISECEDECSKKRNSCNAFAFGVGIKGNGTCALSAKLPKPEELQFHADYDVYVRSQRSPHCESDRIYKMGSGFVQKRRNETRPITKFGSGFLTPITPGVLSPTRAMENMIPSIANNPSYRQGYIPSLDDERRISDILRNKNPMLPASNPFGTTVAKIDNYNDLSIYSNRKTAFGQRIHFRPNNDHSDFGGSSYRNPFADISHLNIASPLDGDLHSYKALTVHNEPFDVFSRPIYVHNEVSRNRFSTESTFRNNLTKFQNVNRLNQHQEPGFLNNMYKDQRIITRPKQNKLAAESYDTGKMFHPTTSNSYGFEANGAKISNGRFKDISEIWNPEPITFRGFGAKISEKPKSCYRRLLSGKKSLELHVRRAIECERIEDCHRACDYEKHFICEGFNYKRIGHGSGGMCEMTSIPYSRMDLYRDFLPDPQCDYYEKDPSCVTNTSGTQPSWWNQLSQSYGPSYSSNGRPDAKFHPPDRRPLNEMSRPLDHDRHPLKEIPRPLDFHRRPTNEIPQPLNAQRPMSLDRQPPFYGEVHRVVYDDTFGQRNHPTDQDLIRDRYPATRTGSPFDYSSRFPPRRPTDDFYNRNTPWAQYPKYPNRRIDHGSYDIGTNEIGSYLPSHRKDPNRDWDPYNTVYGGSYGYDTNYVDKFDVPKYYPPKSQPKSPQFYENDHFYGEFYNYGGAFGYGDSYIPADQDPLYSGTVKTDECSVRAGAGFRLSRGVVRKTYLTPNLDQCERLCVSEKNYICMSFSYRYNVAPTDPTDNCLLSDVSYRDLNFYTDLEPDRDYDIYAMITNSRTCGTKREQSQHPPDECFWRVRSGFGMPMDVVRKSVIVDNLGECQVECMIMRDFTCRSFAFKYDVEQGRQDIATNCYLSDWPSQDINPANMPDMDGAELYERGSFGRGCEVYIPFFNMERFNGKQSSSQGKEACYSAYNKPCKLTPYAVLAAIYVNSEQDCRQKCSKMRENDFIPCMSYSYKLTSHGTEENCLLSDVPSRDLQPGLDYIYDDDHVLYAWKDLDPQCMITGYSIDHALDGPGTWKLPFPSPWRPNFNSGADNPDIRPDLMYPDPRPFFTISRPDDHHDTRPFDPDKPDPIRPYRPNGGYGSYDNKFGIRPNNFAYGFGSFYPNEHTTFRYYTVNGYPCKRGTKCERNKIAGFWACETEGSEYGSWDYCCAPTHHCGFSKGYHYPWCYVGASEDQWRPCNEKYFPYLPSPRPIRPPIIMGDDRYNRPHPHDPDYYGRHWPITYLHREPPPNCTDSLASADNSENRRFNETSLNTTAKKPAGTIAAENSTAAVKTHRRRIQSRMALAENSRNNRAIFSRKIAAGITINDKQNPRERAAKIERVSKPANVEPFAASSANVAIVAPLVAATITNSKGAQFERKSEPASDGGNGEMIRISLIEPNNSLPIRA